MTGGKLKEKKIDLFSPAIVILQGGGFSKHNLETCRRRRVSQLDSQIVREAGRGGEGVKKVSRKTLQNYNFSFFFHFSVCPNGVEPRPNQITRINPQNTVISAHNTQSIRSDTEERETNFSSLPTDTNTLTHTHMHTHTNIRTHTHPAIYIGVEKFITGVQQKLYIMYRYSYE